jgi:hypothetical protein
VPKKRNRYKNAGTVPQELEESEYSYCSSEVSTRDKFVQTDIGKSKVKNFNVQVGKEVAKPKKGPIKKIKTDPPESIEDFYKPPSKHSQEI